MKGLIVITRPLEDADDYAKELEAQGFACLVEPILEIQPIDFETPDLTHYDGILFTSANAVRALGQSANIPAYCVGKYTGAAARELGFQKVIETAGTGADLAAHVVKLRDTKFLHVRGQDIAFPIAETLECDDLIVYTTKPVRVFSHEFLDALKAEEISAITFFSKRTAENFVRLATENTITAHLKSIQALSISNAVLECVRVCPWAETYVSKTPDRAGMLEQLKAMTMKGDQSMRKVIENAQDVIEAFGGIRPMAKKMDIAVTTVQGWKKRGAIPEARKDALIKAAGSHGIDLAGLLDGAPAANENKASKPAETPPAKPPQTKQAAKTEPVKEPEQNPEQNTVLKEKQSESNGIMVAITLVILAAIVLVGALYVFFNPGAQDVQRLSEAQQAPPQEQEEAAPSFLGNLIPEKLGSQIDDLASQTQQAVETAQTVATDVLADDGRTLEERAIVLETHLEDITGGPVLQGVLDRYAGLEQQGREGQAQLAQTLVELNRVLSKLGSSSADNVNAALEQARGQSAALGQSFEGVPQQDLKAAALLLGMSQFRSSLNRDNQAFDNDLTVLQNLIGPKDAELNAAIARLAPHAKSGVLTPSGLTDEFRKLAGDAVVASLKGEDVSLQERAAARMNELFAVEKDGEMITGTETQMTLAKTEKLLEAGDVQGAIAHVQQLDGPAAAAIAPWIEQAQATLLAGEARTLLQNNIGQATGLELGSGVPVGAGWSKLYQDKESGMNVYVPARRHDKSLYE